MTARDIGRAARSLLAALAVSPADALAKAQPEPDAEIGAEVVVEEGADREGGRARRPWYVPDHAKLQLAGDIGFLSPGLGWELAGDRVHLDLFLGWVPAAVGGEDIYSATAKVAWGPWHLRGARWRVDPVRVGAQLTYTFGSQYFLTAPDRYPSGYYELPTALHGGVTVGGSAWRAARGGRRAVGVYWEAVALVRGIRDHLENPNVVDPADVVSLAVGTMLRF